MAVYVAPSVYLRRDALTQAENVFPEKGSRVILGSMTKEHEDPFGRWLCEELERQNPEDVAMIVKAEQETQTSPDDVVDAKEHSELKTLLAQHHQKCFEVYYKGYTRIEEAVFDKIKIAGMTMVSFMRIFSGRGAENKIFRRRQILAVFDEAQDYHLFQALGMAMGVHRQHAQVRTMVVRMRNMKAVGMLCKAFHDFLSNVGLTVDKSRMALWPADGDSAEKTRNALEYLYQEGSRQHFERFLELEDEK